MPGEYDITFMKESITDREVADGSTGEITVEAILTYEIPQRYGDPTNSGLEPIKVDPKGVKNFTFELSSTAEDQQAIVPGSGGTTSRPPGTSLDLSRAIQLRMAIQENGFGNRSDALRAFLQFGTASFERRRNEARSPQEIEVAQAIIRNEQIEIAETIYFENYAIAIDNVQIREDGNSRLNLEIFTGISYPSVGEVSLPMQNVEKTRDFRTTGGIGFTVSGNTDSIEELRDNRTMYRATIWFTSLRITGLDSASANVLKIEIVKVQRDASTPQ